MLGITDAEELPAFTILPDQGTTTSGCIALSRDHVSIEALAYSLESSISYFILLLVHPLSDLGHRKSLLHLKSWIFSLTPWWNLYKLW